MVDVKDQRFLNISPKSDKSRVTFSQSSWCGLVAAGLLVGVIQGAPLWLAVVLFGGLSLPVSVWMFAKNLLIVSPRTFDGCYLSAWAIACLFAMSVGGGALSPLTVILVVGPLAALSIGRTTIFADIAVFGLLVYALAIFSSFLGWSDFVPRRWWIFAPPLAIAAMVQIVILVWVLNARFVSDDEEEAGNISTPIEPADDVIAENSAEPPVPVFKLPILILEIAAQGRIRRLEGAEYLRWPGLAVGKIASSCMGPIDGEKFTSPDGRQFQLLRQFGDDGGEWLALVPEHGSKKEVMKLTNSLRDALAKAERAEDALTERTAFFAGLGHDLKTPLNAILGFADLMKAEVRGPLPDAYKDYPAIIHESGQDLMLLVDDILDLAKAEASGHRLDLEPVDLVASAASVVRQLQDQADRAQIKLILKNEGEVWAEADARAVRQIWQNLISNAIKYSDEGSSITLSAGKAAGSVAMSVKDRGAGMDQEDLDRIATPFAQGANAKGRAGTGLGLAVVNTFAKLHGGKVVIDTEKGKGTRVRVVLPALDVSRLSGLKDAAQ